MKIKKNPQEDKVKRAFIMAIFTGAKVFEAVINDEIKTKEDFNKVCKEIGDYLEKNFIEHAKKLEQMSVKELKQLIGELVVQEKYEECQRVKALIEFKTKK